MIRESSAGGSRGISAGIALIAAITWWGGVARAQEAPTPPLAEPPSLQQEQTQQNPTSACDQPPPLVSWQDYQGPMEKVVGIFGRKLERKSVHPPHYKPGAVLCTLDTKDKFILFLNDSIDPVTFLGAAFNGGISQAENDDPSYGQGMAGYGKRFGAGLAGEASGYFFGDFLYPAIFSEDPRYYRLAHGPGGTRFLHAVEHSVLAHRPDGTTMFNYSEWLGTASAIVLSNTYHPDNRRGVAPVARNLGYSISEDIGFDVLREFWPEIARKFKLPFRDRDEPTN